MFHVGISDLQKPEAEMNAEYISEIHGPTYSTFMRVACFMARVFRDEAR